jgi:hypothetical protein
MLAINDEYREYNSWPVAMQGSNGVFTKTLSLVARRNGNDLDGRKYTLTVTVKDKANPANISEQSVVVLVPHDQGKK